jgi:hypothetical protein
VDESVDRSVLRTGKTLLKSFSSSSPERLWYDAEAAFSNRKIRFAGSRMSMDRFCDH